MQSPAVQHVRPVVKRTDGVEFLATLIGCNQLMNFVRLKYLLVINISHSRSASLVFHILIQGLLWCPGASYSELHDFFISRHWSRTAKGKRVYKACSEGRLGSGYSPTQDISDIQPHLPNDAHHIHHRWFTFPRRRHQRSRPSRSQCLLTGKRCMHRTRHSKLLPRPCLQWAYWGEISFASKIMRALK